MTKTDLPRRDSAEETLSQHSEHESIGIAREFWLFLRHHKKWWLVPLLLARPLRGIVAPARVPRLATATGGTVLILLGLWVAARPFRVGAHEACHVEAARLDAAPQTGSATVAAPLEQHGG